jgi:chemotaxis protein MotA
MFLGIGLVVLFGAVIGSYIAEEGDLKVLIQPFELTTILGAALGAFVVGNPMNVIKGSIGGVMKAIKGPAFKKAHYVEVLSLMFDVFKLAKQKGMIAIEPHVENPETSDIFSKYPGVSHDHHLMDFLRDYLRMLTLGTDKAHELEAVMDAEIDAHHKSEHLAVAALQNFSDGLPALGIVAAVLGVIKTMGAMDQPPEVLGHLIGAALVGTFAGILMCYGIFGPIANAFKSAGEADSRMYLVIRNGILAYLQGYAPPIAIEMARKTIDAAERPSFYDMEAVLGK